MIEYCQLSDLLRDHIFQLSGNNAFSGTYLINGFHNSYVQVMMLGKLLSEIAKGELGSEWFATFAS